jgi:hypothetical protein
MPPALGGLDYSPAQKTGGSCNDYSHASNKYKKSDLGKRVGRSDACQIAQDGLLYNFMPTYSELANHQVLSQPVYEAGRPIEVVAREFGLDSSSVIKLASNENPSGPSPLGLAAAKKALDSAHLYPDGSSTFLREKLAKIWSMQPNQFVIGNGSNEVMILLAQAFLRPGS